MREFVVADPGGTLVVCKCNYALVLFYGLIIAWQSYWRMPLEKKLGTYFFNPNGGTTT